MGNQTSQNENSNEIMSASQTKALIEKWQRIYAKNPLKAKSTGN